MSSETYARPRPATHSEQQSFAAARYAAEIDALQKEVGKRFWTLKLDPKLNWHYVEDQLGRPLCPPMILPSLRGWVASLPPQA
ncbi:MAG: hypothetical protein EBT03_07950 [Betaproteobacteria bacterium]|nr:hypothetical protein [Betaproteobacteria bacterium]NCA17028.1 hypothetical protein [Betaproteobacteria bacterium]